MSLPTKRKLLIADDSVAVQKIVQLTFDDEGYTVTAVGDGRRALDEIEQDVPDVVLADVTMPEINGYQVCARIKRDERLRRVKVILLVGAFEPFNEAEARKVGADDFLTKPFQSIREMVSKVGNLFGGGSKHEAETAEHEAIHPPGATGTTTNESEHATTYESEHAATVAVVPTVPSDAFAATYIHVATTQPLPSPPADESSLINDPLPIADPADFAYDVEPAKDARADFSPSHEPDEPLAAEESLHAGGISSAFDEKPFDEKPFDDDDRNIDVTPFDEIPSHDATETYAVESSSNTENTDLFFGDDAPPLVDAYAEAISVEPDEPDEPASRPDLEIMISDEPTMSLTDSTHAPDDTTFDENALLDLDDFAAPTPHAVTVASQSTFAPEPASTADNDEGLLDLDVDMPPGIADFSDAAIAQESPSQIFDFDEPAASSTSDNRDERIPLDEIFPPRTCRRRRDNRAGSARSDAG
jgi:CheY-like chemotaxis protein